MGDQQEIDPTDDYSMYSGGYKDKGDVIDISG